MQTTLLTFVPLLAPFLLLGYAGLLAMRRSSESEVLKVSGESIGLIGIVIALICATRVFINGPFQSTLLGINELGFSIRLDALSVSMLVMIAILGFVILRFSANYLDGEKRKSVFFSRLAVTIASVELLILSGNLFQIFFFWVITSVCLHSLLVFYRKRPQAVAAARKKFIVARLGDISLLLAIYFIYRSLGTGNLSTIFEIVQSESFVMDGWLNWATALLVITAALKSAQFPTHGWLIEVVETPTPVSALLHAGLLNAGPFLMVRMSFLMIESSTASMMLIIIGGLTAMIASVVYMTQASIKIALGYSSVAHMGFSLMICGFGVYTAAILHVVAHSFYKAHAFLSSGSAVDVVRSKKFTLPKRKGSILRLMLSISLALGMYFLFCNIWGIHPEQNFNLMAIGLIIVMGLAQMLAATIDTKGSGKAIVLTIGMALIVSTSFFTLEHGARVLLGSEIPELQQPVMIVQWAIASLLVCYAFIIGLQLLAPRLMSAGIGYRLGVHMRNGFYANVIFDRMIGSLKNEKFKWANLTVEEEKSPDTSIETIEKMVQQPELLVNH
ncbi:proton-conducting transporter membrane subunit [Ekhidna sp.]|uniref:proton-conducting transporter transmembrane domain-containing protein n=1 Tax=Ekhidna sp. TaxID=2608089 RepID=UPI003BAC5D43